MVVPAPGRLHPGPVTREHLDQTTRGAAAALALLAWCLVERRMRQAPVTATTAAA